MTRLFEGRGYKLHFVRAKEDAGALTVYESVQHLIENSHICLGVVTGLNPNVLYEVGYAERGRIPIILVLAEAIEQIYMPVLVAHKLREPYNGSMFDEAEPHAGLLMDFQERLVRLFDLAVKLVKGMERPTPGFRVFTDRQAAGLPDVVADAGRTIDLVTTNLSYFADEENFAVDEHGEKHFAFDIAVRKKVRIRILTLDPDSIIASYRAKQLNREHDVAGYREELREAAKFFYHRYEQGIDILVYDDLPLQSTLIADGRVISSFVSRGHQARFNIHVGFDRDFPGARPTFEEHFAEVRASQVQTVCGFRGKANRIPG